jgi:hypothetical protein
MKFNKRLIILILVFCCSFSHQSVAMGEERIPDLKGTWRGTAFLCANTKGISLSNKRINLIVLKQSGYEFSGNIETADKGKRLLGFTGYLNKRDKYIWYFSIVTERGNVDIGYLITENRMKVNLRAFSPNTDVAVCSLTKAEISSD